MDRYIKVGYFKVGAEPGIDPIDVLLRRVAALPIRDRELDIGGGILVRLECLEDEDGCLLGQVTRRQMDNLPPEATEDELMPLPLADGSGVGYTVVFCYDPELSVLALQVNKLAVSLGRFSSYLMACDPGANYSFQPIATRDAWARFNAGQPRKLTVQLASLGNPALVEGDRGSLLSALVSQIEAFNAPQITIEISMGRSGGFLSGQRVGETIRRFVNNEDEGVVATKVRATSKPNDGSEADEIDFLQEFLCDQDWLTLSRDPIENYTVRKNYVRSRYFARREAIRADTREVQ